jgi:hypothetical protein
LTPPELRRLAEVVWGRLGLGAAMFGAVLLLPLALDITKQELASVVVIYAIVCVSLTLQRLCRCLSSPQAAARETP